MSRPTPLPYHAQLVAPLKLAPTVRAAVLTLLDHAAEIADTMTARRATPPERPRVKRRRKHRRPRHVAPVLVATDVDPRPRCARCAQPYTRRGPAQKYCDRDACRATGGAQ